MKVWIPPIKSQGIKTKLVPWIRNVVPADFDGRWIEPFMGTGVVGFNIAPKNALMCDTNPHLINFYTAVLQKKITPSIVRHYLIEEGEQLEKKGESHYYAIRERFNTDHQPLDFLFLSRAGFNGMIRFNRKGGYNVPFCRKPQRFMPAYITKIVNQVAFVSELLEIKQFEFVCQSFEKTIGMATERDIVYCDPPYIGRHTTYYDSWDDTFEQRLFTTLSHSPAPFILSTWHHNDYRKNEYIPLLWERFTVLTREHFYHVGATENNRHPMIEAIVTNIETIKPFIQPKKPMQLNLLQGQPTAV